MDHIIERTDWGWMGAAVDNGVVAAVVLPCSSFQSVIEELEGKTGTVGIGTKPDAQSERIMALLLSYLKGEERKLAIPYSVPGWATPFQRRVWEAVSHIPFGQTRSYGWVAIQAGSPKGARAVGQAMRRNPVPLIVPCHRVIASDGSLGGFTGGLAMKKRLLENEDFDFKALR